MKKDLSRVINESHIYICIPMTIYLITVRNCIYYAKKYKISYVRWSTLKTYPHHSFNNFKRYIKMHAPLHLGIWTVKCVLLKYYVIILSYY